MVSIHVSGGREGFSYIPSLELFVSDDIALPEMYYPEAKELLRRRGTRILRPEEFWAFYDFCSEERKDIIEHSRKRHRIEFLDAYTFVTQNGTCLVVEPLLYSDGRFIWGYGRGKVYTGVDPLEGVPKPETLSEGIFARGNIDLETGLPKIVRSDGELRYIGREPGVFPKPVVISWYPSVGISLNTDERFSSRECYKA